MSGYAAHASRTLASSGPTRATTQYGALALPCGPMRERILLAWIVRSVLLLASGVAFAAAAIVGTEGETGDLTFRMALFGIALYVVSRILDKR